MTSNTAVAPGAFQEGIGRRYHHSLQPPLYSTACGFVVASVQLLSWRGKKYFGGWCWKVQSSGKGIVGYCTWHTNGLTMVEGTPDLKICDKLKEMLK